MIAYNEKIVKKFYIKVHLGDKIWKMSWILTPNTKSILYYLFCHISNKFTNFTSYPKSTKELCAEGNK